MVILKKEEEKPQEEEQMKEEKKKEKHGIEQKRKLSTPGFPFMKYWVGSPPRELLSPSLSEDDVGWGEIGPHV